MGQNRMVDVLGIGTNPGDIIMQFGTTVFAATDATSVSVTSDLTKLIGGIARPYGAVVDPADNVILCSTPGELTAGAVTFIRDTTAVTASIIYYILFGKKGTLG